MEFIPCTIEVIEGLRAKFPLFGEKLDSTEKQEKFRRVAEKWEVEVGSVMPQDIAFAIEHVLREHEVKENQVVRIHGCDCVSSLYGIANTGFTALSNFFDGDVENLKRIVFPGLRSMSASSEGSYIFSWSISGEARG